MHTETHTEKTCCTHKWPLFYSKVSVYAEISKPGDPYIHNNTQFTQGPRRKEPHTCESDVCFDTRIFIVKTSTRLLRKYLCKQRL